MEMICFLTLADVIKISQQMYEYFKYRRKVLRCGSADPLYITLPNGTTATCELPCLDEYPAGCDRGELCALIADQYTPIPKVRTNFNFKVKPFERAFVCRIFTKYNLFIFYTWCQTHPSELLFVRKSS